VDETECVGCNLCSLVCPVEGCITMEERPTGLAPQTWDERVQAGQATPRAVEESI
jgi:dihydropyrimidine dehydrogenase (NAD+) subunit PreA